MVKFKPYFERHYPRLERVIAIIALINLGLVFFNLTYLNLRQFYRQVAPSLVQVYDPVKGIEAHPETEYYQGQVNRLAAQIAQTGLQSPQVETSLSELRGLSQQLLAETAFVEVGGDRALATLQQNIRMRTGQTFARDAFNQFWSVAYLEQQGWQRELEYWDSQGRPFLQANYYRRVNALGAPVDYFWIIDLPFVLIFAIDFVARLTSMRQRYPHLTWLDMGLRRWYDLFLLLPFWRWLRVIPVTLRLYQVDLLDLEPVRGEIQREIIVAVGVDLAGIIGIQIIEQMQDSIRRGDLLDWLSPAHSGPHPNGSISPVDEQEVKAIAEELYDVSVEHILPRIQPDIEDLVQHSLTSTLEQVPGYPQVSHLPGLGRVSTQVVQQLSSSVAQGVYSSMANSLLDSEGKEITARLQRNLRDAIAEELRQHNTLQNIQSTLIDILEDIKRNYIKAIVETGGEELAKRTEQLRRQLG